MSNIGCPVCGGDHYKSQHNQCPPNCRCKLDTATGGINRLNCPVHGTGIQPQYNKDAKQYGEALDGQNRLYPHKEAKEPVAGRTSSQYPTSLDPFEEAKPADLIEQIIQIVSPYFDDEIDERLTRRQLQELLAGEATALCKYGRELNAPNDKYCANEDCPCTALSPVNELEFKPTYKLSSDHQDSKNCYCYYDQKCKNHNGDINEMVVDNPKRITTLEEAEQLVKLIKRGDSNVNGSASALQNSDPEQQPLTKSFCTKHQLKHGQKYKSCTPDIESDIDQTGGDIDELANNCEFRRERPKTCCLRTPELEQLISHRTLTELAELQRYWADHTPVEIYEYLYNRMGEIGGELSE